MSSELHGSTNTPITHIVGETQETAGGKPPSPIVHRNSNDIDSEKVAHRDKVTGSVDKVAKLLGDPSTTGKASMSKTFGRAVGRALTGLGEAVKSTVSVKNIFPQSDVPKSPRSKESDSVRTSPPKASPSISEKKDYSSLSAEEMKELFLTDTKGNNIGESSSEKQDFCKALLSKLGDDAGAFVRERSHEMYSQVTNAQSIGRGNTSYSALATAYLDSKLQFQTSEGFKQLQNAVKNPKEDRTEAANKIWTTITNDLMHACMQDPDLKQFMQQLYTSHLAIFQKGQDTGNKALQDTQMKSGGEVKPGVFTMELSAEQCASKMVLNTLMLRVINPPIAELITATGKPTEKEELLAFSKIFQGGVNLTVKSEKSTIEDKQAAKGNALIDQTVTFITAHKDQILDFGRQFAPPTSPRWESARTQGNTSPGRAGSPQLGMQRITPRGPPIDLSTPDVAPAQPKPHPSVEGALVRKAFSALNSISAEIAKPGANKAAIFEKLDALLGSKSFQQLVSDPENGVEDKFNQVMDQLERLPKTPHASPRSDLEQ